MAENGASLQAARPSRRADAPLSARLSLLLQSARARPARKTSSTPQTWARVFTRGRGARRPAGASLRRRAGARRDLVEITAAAHAAGLYTNLITSAVGITAETFGASWPKPASTTCRSRSRTASARPPTTSPATKAPSPASARSPPKSCSSKSRSRSMRSCTAPTSTASATWSTLALALGASRVEIAHVQYYGWALKNRAALMPTRRAGQARGRDGRGIARAASRQDRHRCGGARLLRAAFRSLASAAGAGARST